MRYSTLITPVRLYNGATRDTLTHSQTGQPLNTDKLDYWSNWDTAETRQAGLLRSTWVTETRQSQTG